VPVRETDVEKVIFFLGSFVFLFVAISDFRTRRIPNEAIVVILLLAAVRIGLEGQPSAALYTLAASTALFAATFLLFWRGLLGGGDVKLMAATALLIGYKDLFSFLFVMSVCGGLVALAVFAGDRLGRGSAAARAREDQEPTDRLTVPYGIAISLAATFTMFVQTSVTG
jgi:prepilin peptidase CpaA